MATESPTCPKQCIIIGIGGVTNGGKTSLCEALTKHLPNSKTTINMDDYYWEENSPNHVPLEEFNNYGNYEGVSSVDFTKLLKDVKKWISDVTKTADNGNNEGTPVLLIEGILIFNFKPLVPLFDKKYFFTLSEDVCWHRRRLRTYLPPEPDGYFEQIAWPWYLSNKEELQDQQDIVYLDGTRPQEAIFEQVLGDTKELLDLHSSDNKPH